jgi:hypothetical protein
MIRNTSLPGCNWHVKSKTIQREEQTNDFPRQIKLNQPENKNQQTIFSENIKKKQDLSKPQIIFVHVLLRK